MKDPLQRRFFRESFLKELFCLLPPKKPNGEKGKGGDEPETVVLFSEAENVIRKKKDDDESEDEDDNDKEGKKGGDEQGEDKEKSNSGETDFLKELIDNDSITTAVNHDKIIEGEEEKLDDDSRKLKADANRFALQSIRALKLSRALCKQQQQSSSSGGIVNTTWTGKSGTAGAPSNMTQKKRFGGDSRSVVSSSSVIQSSKVSSNPHSLKHTTGEEGTPPAKKKNAFDSFFSGSLKLNTEPVAEQKEKVESRIFAPLLPGGVRPPSLEAFLSSRVDTRPVPLKNQPGGFRMIMPSNPKFAPLLGCELPPGGIAGLKKNAKKHSKPAKSAPLPDEEVVNRFTLELHKFLMECRNHTASIETLKGVFEGVISRSRVLTVEIFKAVLKELAVYSPKTKSWTLKEYWVDDSKK